MTVPKNFFISKSCIECNKILWVEIDRDNNDDISDIICSECKGTHPNFCNNCRAEMILEDTSQAPLCPLCRDRRPSENELLPTIEPDHHQNQSSNISIVLNKNIDKFKDYLHISQSILTITAIIVGGIWFFINREHRPKINVVYSVSHKKIHRNWHWLYISIEFINVGKRFVQLDDGVVRIEKILPLETKLNEAIENQDRNNVFTSDNTTIKWPSVGEILSNDPRIRVEPGEKDRKTYEFLVPSSVEVVKIYSHFTMKRQSLWGRSKKPWGWTEDTIHSFTRAPSLINKPGNSSKPSRS